MQLGEYFKDYVRGAALEDVGIGVCTMGPDSVSVPLDLPLCCREKTEACVTFEDSGRVVLTVRDELGIPNKQIQSLLDATTRQVEGLLPEWISMSIFRAPSEAADFGSEKEFHAELSIN